MSSPERQLGVVGSRAQRPSLHLRAEHAERGKRPGSGAGRHLERERRGEPAFARSEPPVRNLGVIQAGEARPLLSVGHLALVKLARIVIVAGNANFEDRLRTGLRQPAPRLAALRAAVRFSSPLMPTTKEKTTHTPSPLIGTVSRSSYPDTCRLGFLA